MHWPLLESSGWVPVTHQDELLYADFFARSSDTFSYENSWAFISQETRLCGIRYLRDGLLLTAVRRYWESPFIFIFPPLGPSQIFAHKISTIAAELATASGKRIVLRKLPRHIFDVAINTGSFVHLPSDVFWDSRDLPEDINPQVILDINAAITCDGSHSAKIRNHLAHFSNHYNPRTEDLSQCKVNEVISLIHQWNKAYRVRDGHAMLLPSPAPMGIDISAYTVFVNIFSARIDRENYFSKVIYIGDSAVGFTFAARTSPQTAALYSNISLIEYRGSSEYLTMELLTELHSRGIKWLNMGGSETKGLFDFKTKFCVKDLLPCFDAEFLR